MDKKAKEAGISRSDYILQLLSSTLNIPICSNGKSPNVVSRIDSLESKVESLAKELAKVVSTLNALNQKIDGIQRIQLSTQTEDDSKGVSQ